MKLFSIIKTTSKIGLITATFVASTTVMSMIVPLTTFNFIVCTGFGGYTGKVVAKTLFKK